MGALALVTFHVVPASPSSLKYSELAPIAAARLRRYARAHALPLFERPPELAGSAPCWGKLTVLLQALERFDAALWVDADALVQDGAGAPQALLRAGGDIVAQEPAAWFARTRLDPARGRDLQPVNTGVFAVRRGGADLLRAALARATPLPAGREWNGLGDQEALAEVIRAGGHGARVAYVDGLQLPPASGGDALFVHHFGDRARYRYPQALCRTVVRVLGRAPRLAAGQEALLHWCAIQRIAPAQADRGGPERFGYQPSALDAALRDLIDAGQLRV